jgi:beta-glucosidase
MNTANDTIVVSIEVSNNSAIEGKEVVQLFVSDLVASVVPAGKRLIGFEKITLKPYEAKKIDFNISTEDLKFVDNSGKWILEKGFFELKINQLNSRFELK